MESMGSWKLGKLPLPESGSRAQLPSPQAPRAKVDLPRALPMKDTRKRKWGKEQ